MSTPRNSVVKAALRCIGHRSTNPAVVSLLLERGADVNSINQREESDFYGITPLMMNALMKDDSAEVTRLLIDAGADLIV